MKLLGDFYTAFALLLLACTIIGGIGFVLNTLSAVIVASTVAALLFIRVFIWIGSKHFD